MSTARPTRWPSTAWPRWWPAAWRPSWGLFGKLFALLLAFKKIIFVAVAAVGATVFKRFKDKPEAAPVEAKVSLEKPGDKPGD